MQDRNMLLLLILALNSLGVLADDPALRIVGGHPVSITDRPFQVLIHRVTNLGLIPDCGGAIISRRWILTAAHCVSGMRPDSLKVSAGTDRLRDDEEAVWFEIERVIYHERFNQASPGITHDIALIMTRKTISFGPKIKPITVSKSSPEPSAEAIVSGFGVTQEGGGEMSDLLREVAVKVLDYDECLKLLAQLSPQLKLSNTHFCAAYLDGGRDACQGDSGGPITIGDTLAGIVSWGIGCAERMVPAFYTDVSLFIPWIRENIDRYSTPDTRKCKSHVPNKGNN